MTSTTEDLRRAIFTLAVSGIMVILVTDSASKQRSVTSIAALDNSSGLHVKVDLLVRSVDRYGNRNNEQLPRRRRALARDSFVEDLRRARKSTLSVNAGGNYL